jgi:hypothetical protein
VPDRPARLADPDGSLDLRDAVALATLRQRLGPAVLAGPSAGDSPAAGHAGVAARGLLVTEK